MSLMSRIKSAIGLCRHQWQTIARYAVNRCSDGKQVGEVYMLQCVHCGNIKRKRV